MAVRRRTKASAITTITVDSWAEFLGHIADSPYSNWAFRGQSHASWPLGSALSRRLTSFGIDPRAWRQQEERMLRVFKRKAHNFLSPVPPHENHFEWLALMEHHGAPTRLLDMTWSPYVAAFFALENATDTAAVWAINPAKVNDATARGAKAAAIDPRKSDNFERHFLAAKSEFVWIGEPERMNHRLVAQSGTFAVPSVLSRTIGDIVADIDRDGDTLVKFVLPASRVRDRGMRELYTMNITQATLFPGLDGLARSLAYELEFHWAYDPHRMP
jgi:hypothetical protein